MPTPKRAATNYPLVRIVHKASGRVRYCRTSNHTASDASSNATLSMGVATGKLVVATKVEIPADIDLGDSALFVIAIGIPPDPFDVRNRFRAG